MAGTVVKTATMTSGSSTALPALTGAQSVTQWLQPLLPLHAKNVNARAYVASYPVGTQTGTVRQTKWLDITSSVTSNITNPTVRYARARFFVDSAGQWAMDFHTYIISTGQSIATGSGVSVGISNIVTANISGYYGAPISCYLLPGSGVISSQAWLSDNQSSLQITIINTGSTQTMTQIGVSGVIYLKQEPTTYTTQANMEGGNAAVASAPYGGLTAYSPTQNRIYLAPYNQATATTWQYIDCNNGSIVSYTHGATCVAGGYEGLAFSPTQNRIYMAPRGQATTTTWHYIDCSNGSVVAYTHGATGITSNVAYIGACYSPTQNRIYFIPGAHATATTWHYVDCSNGSIVAYTHGTTAVGSAYQGAAYHPALNRIYMAPYYQSSATMWHYIDCSNGSVVAYSHGQGVLVAGAYQGPCYSPLQNRIYLAPTQQATASVWHYVGATADTTGLSPHMFGSTILTSNF
jgi:hypothetical protein